MRETARHPTTNQSFCQPDQCTDLELRYEDLRMAMHDGRAIETRTILDSPENVTTLLINGANVVTAMVVEADSTASFGGGSIDGARASVIGR
jgi:hypothetical protein